MGEPNRPGVSYELTTTQERRGVTVPKVRPIDLTQVQLERRVWRVRMVASHERDGGCGGRSGKQCPSPWTGTPIQRPRHTRPYSHTCSALQHSTTVTSIKPFARQSTRQRDSVSTESVSLIGRPPFAQEITPIAHASTDKFNSTHTCLKFSYPQLTINLYATTSLQQFCERERGQQCNQMKSST